LAWGYGVNGYSAAESDFPARLLLPRLLVLFCSCCDDHDARWKIFRKVTRGTISMLQPAVHCAMMLRPRYVRVIQHAMRARAILLQPQCSRLQSAPHQSALHDHTRELRCAAYYSSSSDPRDAQKVFKGKVQSTRDLQIALMRRIQHAGNRSRWRDAVAELRSAHKTGLPLNAIIYNAAIGHQCLR